MAYNYYPVNYQQPYQSTNFPQPVNYPAQTGIIWVNSGVEAQAYPVAPNAAVTLWSTTEPIVYLKKTDASGKPTLVTYDLVERKDTPINKEETTYATKDDLSAVAASIDEFNSVITGIKTDIEAMKSDMYGIAGKKRKKGEETDE